MFVTHRMFANTRSASLGKSVLHVTAILATLFLAVAGASHAAECPLMRDFVGINGHTVQFKPELYRPACGLVRDYHPVEWDLGENTAQLPMFPFAKNRVDWSRIYGSWGTNGWKIDACLMFESIRRELW